MSLPPGTRLGPYEVLASIGAGGMGEVYLAENLESWRRPTFWSRLLGRAR